MPKARTIHRKRRYLGDMSFTAEPFGSAKTLRPFLEAAGKLQDPRNYSFEAKGGRVEDGRIRGGLERGGRAFGVLAVALFHGLPDTVELGLAAGLVRPPARPLFGGGGEVYLQLRVGQDDRSDIPALDDRSPLLAGSLCGLPLHSEEHGPHLRSSRDRRGRRRDLRGAQLLLGYSGAVHPRT